MATAMPTEIKAPDADGDTAKESYNNEAATTTTSTSAAPSESAGGSVNLDFKPRTVKDVVGEKKSFPTKLNLKVTKRMRWVYTVQQVSKIPDFGTPREFNEVLVPFALKELEFYDGLRVGLPDMIEPLWQRVRVTDSGAIGFNVWEFIKNPDLQPGLYNTIRHKLKTYGRDDILSKVSETHNFIGYEWERDLIKEFHAISLEKFVPATELHAFAKFMDDEHIRVAELPSTVDPLFFKVWVDPRYNAYPYVVSRNPFLRDIVYDHVSLHISNNLMVTADDRASGNAMTELKKRLRVRGAELNRENDMTSMIKVDAAQTFIRTMVECACLNKILRIAFEPKIDLFNLSLLIDCIMLKLFVPKRFMAIDSINMIDNYILRHLIVPMVEPKLRGDANHENPIFVVPIDDNESRSHNYLTDAMAFPEMGPHRDFLLTTERGGGWMGREIQVPVTIAASKFFDRTTLFIPISGSVPVTNEDVPDQFKIFTRWFTHIKRVGVRFDSVSYANAQRSFLVILEQVVEGRAAVAGHYYYLHRALRQLTFNTLMMPEPDEQGEDQNVDTFEVGLGPNQHDVKLIHLPQFATYSWLLLIKPDGYGVKNFGWSFLQFGLQVHSWFNSFCEFYHLARDHFTSADLYKLTQIMDMALEWTKKYAITNTIGTQVFELLREAPWRHSLVLPSKQLVGYDDAPLIRKFYRMKELILRYPLRYGYVDRFYFMGSELYDSEIDKFQFYELPSNQAKQIAMAPIGYDDLFDKFVDRQFSAWLDNARANRSTLEIRCPIKYKVVESLPATDRTNAPFEYTHANGLRMRKIPFHYKWSEEEYFNFDDHKFAQLEKSRWVIPDSPVVLDAQNLLLSNCFHKIETLRNGFTIWDGLVFVSRH